MAKAVPSTSTGTWTRRQLGRSNRIIAVSTAMIPNGLATAAPWKSALHGRLDAGRQPAERARHAGDRAKRAGQTGVARQVGEHDAEGQHGAPQPSQRHQVDIGAGPGDPRQHRAHGPQRVRRVRRAAERLGAGSHPPRLEAAPAGSCRESTASRRFWAVSRRVKYPESQSSATGGRPLATVSPCRKDRSREQCAAGFALWFSASAATRRRELSTAPPAAATRRGLSTPRGLPAAASVTRLRPRRLRPGRLPAWTGGRHAVPGRAAAG